MQAARYHGYLHPFAGHILRAWQGGEDLDVMVWRVAALLDETFPSCTWPLPRRADILAVLAFAGADVSAAQAAEVARLAAEDAAEACVVKARRVCAEIDHELATAARLRGIAEIFDDTLAAARQACEEAEGELARQADEAAVRAAVRAAWRPKARRGARRFRPIDMGGPRDEWIERDPWSAW